MTYFGKRCGIWTALVMLLCATATAWAIPINIAVGDFTLDGETQKEYVVESCPPELGCSNLPSFRTVLTFATPVAATATPLNLYVADVVTTINSNYGGLFSATWTELSAAERALLKNLGWNQQAWDTRSTGTGVLWPSSNTSLMDSITLNEIAGAVEMIINYKPSVDPATLFLAVENTVTGARGTTLIALDATSVPEPSTLMLLTIGLACLGFAANKRSNLPLTPSLRFGLRPNQL